MSAVLVDSNVLIDLLTEDERWFDWSAAAVQAATDRGRVIINPIIYAEISVRLPAIEDVEDAFPASVFEREAIPFEAAFLAGKSYIAYRKNGGDRRAALPDLFIGAHAAVRGYTILTRDSTRYRTYFPSVQLTSPG